MHIYISFLVLGLQYLCFNARPYLLYNFVSMYLIDTVLKFWYLCLSIIHIYICTLGILGLNILKAKHYKFWSEHWVNFTGMFTLKLIFSGHIYNMNGSIYLKTYLRAYLFYNLF